MDDPSTDDPADPDDEGGAATAPPTEPAKPRVAKIKYPKWLWAFGIVGGAIMIFCTVKLVQLSDSNATNLGNGAIERLIPAPATQILSQNEVGVDLAPGYTATLVLNDRPIGDDEVTLVPATNSVLFVPGPGKSVEEFNPGQNCIAARYWKPADGEATAQVHSWCFTAL